MHKRIGTATASIRTLSSANLNLAIALWYAMSGARLTYANQLRLVLGICLTQFVQELYRVSANHEVEHILDFVRSRSLMCNDK